MKTIAVFGATGGHGGSVARTLLSGGGYRVRAITRKPGSPAAEKLRALGAEVVHAELDSPPSLNAALQGADAVFGMTSIREHFALAAKHGRHLIEAVAAADVEHFVLSTLEPVEKLDADIREELEELTRKRAVPATFVHVAFLYENFLAFFPPRPMGDGSYELTFPRGNRPLAAVAVDDVGRVVAPQFDLPAMGAVVKVVGDEMPASEYAAILSEATGAKIRYGSTPRGSIDSVTEMFEYYRLQMPRHTAPGLQTFALWAHRNRAKLRASILRAA